MKSLKINKPKILLIGAGHFGKHHLNVLAALDREGFIVLNGVVSLQKEERVWVESFGIKAYSKLTDSLLRATDAVDIVSPPSTHYVLAKRCLPLVHVFLEKPITLAVKEGLVLGRLAKQYKKVLFVGHIYRFHPFLHKLKRIIDESSHGPFFIECIFGDNPHKLPKDCGVLFSDLHGFDIIDYLTGKVPKKIMTFGARHRRDSRFEDDVIVTLEYASNLRASVKLHWVGAPKTRTIVLYFMDKIVTVDLVRQSLVVTTAKGARMIKNGAEMPLALELRSFMQVLKGKLVDYPDATVGTRVLNVAVQAEKSLRLGRVVGYKDL